MGLGIRGPGEDLDYFGGWDMSMITLDCETREGEGNYKKVPFTKISITLSDIIITDYIVTDTSFHGHNYSRWAVSRKFFIFRTVNTNFRLKE